MRRLTLATLAALIWAGCATQPRFAGRPPEFRGEAAESVWREHLGQSPLRHQSKATIRLARGVKIAGEDFIERAGRTGELVAAPAILRTGNNGQLDLFLGDNGPVIRVEENSLISLERLNYESIGADPAGQKVVETMIEVMEGKILGNVKPMEPGSIYLIRTTNGVVRIRGTKFEVRADGETHIFEGQAEIFSGGKRYTVRSGQSYFPNSGLTVGDS